MSYLFVPDMEASDSGLELQCQLLAPSVSWRGKLRPAKSWLRGCRTNPWIERLFGRTSQPLTASRGVERWISSLRESRVSPGALGESKQGLKTSDTSGKSSSVSLAKWDRTTSSWRTSRGLFDREPPTFSGDWPRWGSMRNGDCFPQAELAQLIDGNASSCWPTPQAAAGGTSNNGSPRDGKRTEYATKGKPQLPMMAQQWSTPLSPLVPTETGAESLKSTTQRLNPKFVEWLMGLPDGWTSSGCSATELSRWLQLMRSALYCNESTTNPKPDND